MTYIIPIKLVKMILFVFMNIMCHEISLDWYFDHLSG